MKNGSGIHNEDGFSLPGDYFGGSERAIRARIEWLEEHGQFPCLNALERNNPFGIPAGYFGTSECGLEGLPYRTLSRLRINYFTLPPGYFVNSEKVIKNRLHAKIAGENKNALQSIPKKNSFEVSRGYFEENAARLMQLGNSRERSTIITLFRFRNVTLAAAAALAIVMGVWAYRNYSVLPDAEDCGSIACLDKKDLLKAKRIEDLESDDLYDLVDPGALQENLGGLDPLPLYGSDSAGGKEHDAKENEI